MSATITFRNKKVFPLVQTRPYNSLPLQVINMMQLLTLDPKYPPKIVGSYKYVVHEYPSDIDLFETYEGCCSLEEVQKKIVHRFKEIIEEIDSKPLTYLGDFKAGLDKRYLVDIGTMHKQKLHGYNPDKIRKQMRDLHDAGLLTDDEITLWIRSVHEDPSFETYIDLKHLIHDKSVVRWTSREIIEGHKKLKNAVLLSLEEALNHKSIVKIDIWTNIGGKYIEITNYYNITYLEEGQSSPVYMSAPIKNYEESLQDDLFYYKNHAQMKYAKRLWNYYVLKNMKTEMIALYPLFSSPSAKIHQIIGEIDIIKNLLQKIPKPDMESIKNNIEDWKTRLGTLRSDIISIDIANKLFVKINESLDSRSKLKIIIHINEVGDVLYEAVNRYVKRFLNKTKL